MTIVFNGAVLCSRPANEKDIALLVHMKQAREKWEAAGMPPSGGWQ